MTAREIAERYPEAAAELRAEGYREGFFNGRQEGVRLERERRERIDTLSRSLFTRRIAATAAAPSTPTAQRAAPAESDEAVAARILAAGRPPAKRTEA